MPNSVGIKLEAAIKAYILANYQESGDELEGVQIYPGKSPEDKDKASYITVMAGDAGGAYAAQGNYDIPFQFEVSTCFNKAEGTETEADLRLKHGQRVAAILGIFGNDRTLTVRSALMAIDTELGVSTYWKLTESEDFEHPRAISKLVFMFEAYLQ